MMPMANRLPTGLGSRGGRWHDPEYRKAYYRGVYPEGHWPRERDSNPRSSHFPWLAADKVFDGHLTDASRSHREVHLRIAPGSPATRSYHWDGET